jgi:hypothetical protein
VSRLAALMGVLACCSCSLLPEAIHQPSLHNPYPQLTKIAIAPFFNLSTEPTVDGRRFALAYFNELQLVPGFEVVPIGTVEQALKERNSRLASPEDARRLAQTLGVDAVVIGAVTDYSPYYPPRCALQVEWYAANPGFHPIPPGYGLPWGTPEAQQIPGPLIFEAEMALAKAQLATQTPAYQPLANDQAAGGRPTDGGTKTAGRTPNGGTTVSPGQSTAESEVRPLAYQTPTGGKDPSTSQAGPEAGRLTQWPDPRGFIPPPPSSLPPVCRPQNGPVMRHTQTYNGHDSRVTEALANYYALRDDARFGGWQSYLQRSDDFIRFCCRMHIWEMLSARGGAGETRVVWRWGTVR